MTMLNDAAEDDARKTQHVPDMQSQKVSMVGNYRPNHLPGQQASLARKQCHSRTRSNQVAVVLRLDSPARESAIMIPREPDRARAPPLGRMKKGSRWDLHAFP